MPIYFVDVLLRSEEDQYAITDDIARNMIPFFEDRSKQHKNEKSKIELTKDQKGLLLAEKLSRPIEDLDLSPRGKYVLKGENIKYIGELIQCSASDLLRMPNLGKITLTEIKIALRSLGLSLI